VVELAKSFFNIPAAFFITAKGEKSSQCTFSQATSASKAQVCNAVKFTFDLEKSKIVFDLRVFVFKVNLFPGSFLRGITHFRNF
jgi:hypothetical protein